MKKALLAGVCFMLISLCFVSGTFALPDLNKVFADLTERLGPTRGLPEAGGAGKAVHVSLVSDDNAPSLYPGSSASRTTRVLNQGTGNVCFRLAYAVQYNESSWDKLSIDFTADQRYSVTDWKLITIGSIPYKMKVFTFTEELPAGQSSPEVIITIAMDKSITNQEMATYRSDFLQVQALAIDPVPFKDIAETPAEALDYALPLDTLSPF